MTSPQTREDRGRSLYECYRAELDGRAPITSRERGGWGSLARTVKAKWERIASRYHERIDNG